jgi:hypothetical protein
MKILLLAASFIIPLAGVIIGVLYLQKGDPDNKAFAQQAFIAAGVGFVLYCFCSVCGGSAPFLLNGNF